MFSAATENNLPIVQYLFDHGADVNLVGPDDATPTLAATAHANTFVLRALIEKRADLNRANEEGETPIFHAVLNGNVAALDLLISSGGEGGGEAGASGTQ